MAGGHWLLTTALLALCSPAVADPLTAADLDALRARAAPEGWTFAVGRNTATGRRLADLTGLAPPPDFVEATATLPATETTDLDSPLPEEFDWLVFVQQWYGSDIPVRDQGQCAASWAFATVGMMEWVLKINTGVTNDLSVQHLLSCRPNRKQTDGCRGGWFTPQMLLQPGAIEDRRFPYAGRDVDCVTTDLCPVAKAFGHEYIPLPPQEEGRVHAIKRIIWNEGPVAAAVAVNRAFQAYTGGIFNEESDAPPNHAVLLMGWGPGYWLLRNSWGPGWGEAGYMRIRHGCHSVGRYANYVVHPYRDASSLHCQARSGTTTDGSTDGPAGDAKEPMPLWGRVDAAGQTSAGAPAPEDLAGSVIDLVERKSARLETGVVPHGPALLEAAMLMEDAGSGADPTAAPAPDPSTAAAAADPNPTAHPADAVPEPGGSAAEDADLGAVPPDLPHRRAGPAFLSGGRRPGPNAVAASLAGREAFLFRWALGSTALAGVAFAFLLHAVGLPQAPHPDPALYVL